jgi:hypothetical protein
LLVPVVSQRAKGASSVDDIPFALSGYIYRATIAGTARDRRNVTATVDLRRLVERNLGLKIGTFCGDVTDLGSALLPGPHEREYLVS